MRKFRTFGGLSIFLGVAIVSAAQETAPSNPQLEQLLRRIEDLERANEGLRNELNAVKEDLRGISTSGDTAAPRSEPSREPDVELESSASAFQDRIVLSGEAGLAFFHTDKQGAFPNSEFRIDEARLFLDVELMQDTYLFSEILIAERERDDVDLRIGEFYADFEELPWLSRGDHIANLRVGRFDIPFGEEYLTRDAIDNPLISHSLTDFWGIDEGLEFYGRHRDFDYVIAVQNGSNPATFDGDADKSVTGRFGYTPLRDLRLSLSAMRTGDLNVEDDTFSELWFGSGFFRSIGDPETTTSFDVNLVQGDVRYDLEQGHVSAFGGYLEYRDDDTAADNKRDAWYYALEGVHDVTRSLYGAARFSQIRSSDGMPIVGQAPFGTLFSGDLVEDIWRLSLGLGYRWSPKLVLKTEYSLERGDRASGEKVKDRDFFGIELALGF
jgi:hypothetical protein